MSSDYNGPAIWSNRLVLKQVTEGLEYLHEKNIFHRELKPSNVFISRPDGTTGPLIKLANFGIYQRAGRQLLIELSGSKSWLPLEAHEEFSYTAAMDLFSLGCLFSFTLSGGRHPYGDSEQNRICRIKKREPMTLTVHHLKNVKNAAGVFQLICSLLSVDPTERPLAKAVLKHNFFGNSTETSGESSEQGKYFL